MSPRHAQRASSRGWHPVDNVSPGQRLGSRVAVVILNWNGRQYLEPCLRSVFAQEFQDFAVILVDNGSADGSVDFVRERFPRVHLIENSENRGFAAANNQAIRASTSEFVATLNNDTEVDSGWLGALVHAMDGKPRVGMCASKMLLAHREGIIDSVGIAVDKAGIAWNMGGGSIDSPDDTAPKAVFGPCAGAALYRRSMLDEIGLFDEDYFAYLEDVDLAWRAQWAAWQSVYVPTAVVHHVHSGTAKEGSRFKHRLLGRNKVWTLCKNYPFPSLIWYAPLIVAYDLMSVGYAIATGQRRGGLLGRIEALAKVPRMIAKRRRILRRIASRSMMASMHPVDRPGEVLRRYDYARPRKAGKTRPPRDARRAK